MSSQPLEEISIDDNGVSTPALHRRWVEEIKFMPYYAPPINVEDMGEVEQWLECTSFIQDDLDYLLRMKHHKFWCQAIFDTSLHKCIDSYLRFAPRSYDVVYNLNKEMKQRQESLHRLYFMVFLRLATHKESKETFITPQVYGEIIYENFLFDIPKIMDLCVLYGESNHQLLSKMINNIFIQQPKYYEDLHGTIPTLSHVLESICLKCGVNLSTTGSPIKITPGNKSKKPLLDMPLPEFQDIIFYISDTSNTLWSFLLLFPNAAQVFMENGNMDFALRLVNFYEAIIPELVEALQERNWDQTAGLKSLLVNKMRQAQVCLIKSFRQFVCQVTSLEDSSDLILHRLLQANTEDETAHFAEEYIGIMTAILCQKRFLAHLNYLYPFSDDRDIIEQSKYFVDETRLQFIQDAIAEASSIYLQTQPTVESSQASAKTKSKQPPPTNSSKSLHDSKPSPAIGERGDVGGACAPRVTGVELQSMIFSVKDLLPDLGEGFIELCLEELGYDIEKVINSVLENKLPPSLEKVDRTMARDVSKVSEEVQEMESMLDTRLNIYDNDEFDAFRRNIDTSKVITKKKEKTTLTDLDDKSHVAALKPLYDKYGGEQVESMYDTPPNCDYEDEYDDTYDSNLVGAEDADSADELTHRREFVIPRVLQRNQQREGDNSGSPFLDEEDDDDEDSGGGNQYGRRTTYQNFLEDPAVIRQRQEERRAQKAMRGGRKGGGGAQVQSNKPKQYDVVGKAKGQGQDTDTVRNRAWKEKNKAMRVHHNRKNLAAKKGGGF